MSNKDNNNPVNPSEAAGDSGSVTDTIKGYVHVAMTKGHEALHQAHEKLNQAAAHMTSSATSHEPKEHQQQSSTTSTHPASQTSNDAFADVNQFNADSSTQAANVASFPSSNPNPKSSDSGL
ncbi:hypothetical protein BGZ58_009216 [Dissophora ornata]|nr:hypothetical protein BGZ58_009216 [Dissophora ornata]